jgi:hypothetical protein
LQTRLALCKSAYYQTYLKETGQEDDGAMPFYERLHQFYPGCQYYGTSYIPDEGSPIIIINKLLLDSTNAWKKHILSARMANVGVCVILKADSCYHAALDFSSEQIPLLPITKGKKTYNYDTECPKGAKVRVPKYRKKTKRFLFW